MAAAVVAAHNHVLRRWLRGESHDPVREVGEAMEQVIGFFASPVTHADANTGTTILMFRTGQDIDTLLPALQSLAGSPAE